MKIGYKGLGLYLILLGIFLLMINSLQHFWNPSSYDLPVVFLNLLFIITGLFFLREYYNKANYKLVTMVFLVSMWIIIYFQPLSPNADKILYYIETGLVTLAMIVVLIFIIKALDKLKKN